ncbi:MAG TPA: hypothetical protein VJQ84_08190 [Solirubrobacterales bacterium]|nr:hypothetical protein [Solirubrobacterales bacterium]
MATLAMTSTAWSAGAPIGGGKTNLSLARGLDKALRREGIVIKSLGPAKVHGRKLDLPVTSGVLDPDAGNGALAHAGGLKLVAGTRSVALRDLRLDAAGKKVSAILAGRRLQLAALGGVELESEGFDLRLEARRLPLTRAAAAVIDTALGLPNLLRAGRSLGSIDSLAEPSSVQIGYGQIALGGPDTAFSKLESLGVQMGIWGATQRWNAPGENYFLFAIAPTTVAPDASTGVLDGSPNDGVTMQIFAQPPREMLLRDPRIDLATRELAATLSPLSTESPTTETIATLDYSAAKFQFRPKVGAFELMGIRAIANQFIADQLNQRFQTPGLFQAGETLARVTVNLSAH